MLAVRLIPSPRFQTIEGRNPSPILMGGVVADRVRAGEGKPISAPTAPYFARSISYGKTSRPAVWAQTTCSSAA
jgi:hypothetical protein